MAQDDGARVIGLGAVSGRERVERAGASFRTSVPDRGPGGPTLFAPGAMDLQPLLDNVLGAGHLLFFRQHSGTRSVWHTHSCDQILIVVGGAGSILTETAAHQLRPGNVVLIPAGQKHVHATDSDETLEYVFLTTSGHGTELLADHSDAQAR